MSKIILLAGGTGLIGTRLQTLLRAKNHEVRILTRTPRKPGEFAWDPQQNQIDAKALEGVHAIINLAGAGIADGRWTPRRKQLLIDSRVDSARVLQQAIQESNEKPETYMAASAIGWYGNTGEEVLMENLPRGSEGFMPECCEEWEIASEKVGAIGMRTVILRIGVVLATEGGALPEIVKPLKLGIGAYFGNGRAWWSWIHIDDVCNMFLWALEHSKVEGIYNAVAPHPVRNLPLVKATANAMHQKAIYVPAPALALQLMLGEMSAVVLNSNLVSAGKALAAGFHYQYPELEMALGQLFEK
ncbi:MAG: TIGR01777 family protein [Lewinellaceae bacterium]|nr:TIGR01777 family protein [Lewinellaceae bacterium]